MKTLLIITLLIFLSTGFVSCQTKPIETIFVSTEKDTATALHDRKIYRLKKQTTNSDFDNSKLNRIDDHIKDTVNLRNLMPIFEPIKGQFNYFQFLATFKGEGYNGGGPSLIKDFHDILIIKTDKNNKIVDAYQYTLEWGEPPLQYDLYRSSAKGITLTDKMDISTLKFVRTEYSDEKDKFLKDGGIIKLK